MQEQLISLLEYRDVLTAVVSTHDGLVVSTAGLTGEAADIVAAAGAALIDARADDSGSMMIDVEGGRLHVSQGPELMLVVLTGTEISSDQIEPVLGELLEQIEQLIEE